MKQRNATIDDVEALAALDEQSFPPKERWSAELWRQELEADDRFVLVTLGASDEVIGAVTFQLTPDVIDLLRVMVEARWRRMGVARDLVRAGTLYAASHGCPRMLLEVRHDNTEARALYESFGFEVIDTRVDYYGPGVDALVMQQQVDA